MIEAPCGPCTNACAEPSQCCMPHQRIRQGLREQQDAPAAVCQQQVCGHSRTPPVDPFRQRQHALQTDAGVH